MVRDLARDLSDIDIVGVTDFMGWNKVELSPEQAGQLAVVPGARPIWQNTIDESQASVFSPVFVLSLHCKRIGLVLPRLPEICH